MPLSQSVDTKTLRQALRQRRNALSLAQQSRHAELAKTALISLLNNSGNALKIGFFLSQDGELNATPSLDYLLHKTKHQVFLPVLETRPDWHMGFAEYNTRSVMIQNQFNIDEPKVPFNEHLEGSELDMVLMPLVGFDRQGNRLGMGGGYYDRTFAFKKRPKGDDKPILIGWAHQCQQVDELAVEEWDVPLNGIITENGYTPF